MVLNAWLDYCLFCITTFQTCNVNCNIDLLYRLSLTHSLTHWSNLFQNFLLVADLIVDGRNTYQQSQCFPQSNSNSQPEFTRFYLPVSSTLALLPAIRSFLWILPFDLPVLVRPARIWSFCQYNSLGHGITQAPPPLRGWWLCTI